MARQSPSRGRRALLAAIVVLLPAVQVLAMPAAAAAEMTQAGWWWRPQSATLPLPPPPTVPEGGLMVQGAPNGPVAIAAVRFAVEPGATAPTLTLEVAEAGNQGADVGVVLACRTLPTWTGGDAQPFAERPNPDCAEAAPGALSGDGTSITFSPVAEPVAGSIDVVLVPGTIDGSPFNGANGSTFTLILAPPSDDALITSSSSSPATQGGAGAPAATFAPAGEPPAQQVFSSPPPGPVAPALTPVEPAAPTTTAPASGDETAAAPPAPVPAAATSEPLSLGDLLPLLLVLALGPLAVLASRQPRIASALAGIGLAPAGFVDTKRREDEGGTILTPVATGYAKPEEVDPSAPLLSCRGVSVRFGGLQALSDVDLDVHEGEIVGLIGPNGAGKTTLMECISGFQRVTEGRVHHNGVDLLALAPGDRARLGIGRTLQNVRLFPYLTVHQNVLVALHRHQQTGTLAHALRLPSARREERVMHDEAERIVGLVGMQAFADKFASELSYGTLRLLELACMVALKPRFLLLDEPASGISQKETEALGPLLRDIKASTGATILMIEHDMPLVMSLCDRIYCLDAGAVLSTGTPEEIQADPRVAEAYLGTPAEQRKVALAPSRSEDTAAETLLEIEGLDVFYDKVQVLYGVDVHVRRGERIALLGTNGAGKSTILKAASGLITPTSGTVRWKGEDITAMAADKVVRLGLGQVPGGRGLFPTLSVGENLRMGGYILDDEREVDEAVERVVGYFPWIAERADQPAGTLSGGEQQQLATARALITKPELLMIDELSLGLSPIVIERLMDTIQRLCEDEGLTVVIVEQQASFALGYTDRAYFLEKGEVRYSGPSAGLTERDDLLRSVFLAGASAGFAEPGAAR